MTLLPAPDAIGVLIVDDDDDQRHLTTRLFRIAGLRQLHEARNAEEALVAAAVHQPDLIVLDLVMPGRSGLEVLPDLRAAAQNAQVVVLSNMPRGRVAEQVRQRGAVGYVEKRVASDRLVAEILTAAALTDVVRHHVMRLDTDPTAARASRRFVTSLLDESDSAITSDIQLLVSELVTNAVIHASSDPRLEVRISSEIVRVEVYDADPSPAVPRDPDVERPGGRGLLLIAKLANSWGSELVEGGKVVWFELARRRP